VTSGVEFLTCQRCGEIIEASAAFVVCPKCGDQVRPRAPGTKRFILDSNVYDKLVATPERQHLFIAGCESGRIELLLTHIQHDELMAIPDEAKRAAVLSIPFVVTMTYGAVFGTSKWGLARFGETEKIDAIRSPSGKHANDALIAQTAQAEGAVLVTEEHRLRNRARSEGVEVWSAAELIEYVEGLGLDP
jgi:predicted RNA-binding Zn-ribbon protein involved in translation (DUF1610 family)